MLTMSVKGKILSIGLGLVGSLVLVSGVSAENPDLFKENDVEITIKPGDGDGSVGGLGLDVPPITNFEEIILETTAKTHNTGFDGEFHITDLRGTAAGWALSVEASQFKDSETDAVIPQGAFTLGPASIDSMGDTNGLEVLNNRTIIDSGGVLVANAKVGSGLGIFELNFDKDMALALTVDSNNVKVGTYTSTLTWTLMSTPQ